VDQEQNISEVVDQSQSKRKAKGDDEQSSKKQKTNDESESVQDDNNQAVPSNPRFEWYDEIKLALSKATDQTLSLDVLKKKVIIRKKLFDQFVMICFRFSNGIKN
jgi:uncharacterized protein YcfL